MVSDEMIFVVYKSNQLMHLFNARMRDQQMAKNFYMHGWVFS